VDWQGERQDMRLASSHRCRDKNWLGRKYPKYGQKEIAFDASMKDWARAA
jgi:hypothetical protein